MGSSSWLKSALFTGIPFGVLFGAYNAIFLDPATGIIMGVAGGALFGAAMATFFRWMARRTAAKRPELVGETVIHEGVANHMGSLGARGGWLYLTPTALHFRAMKLNLQRGPMTIPLADVAGVEPSRAMGLVPNAITLTTTAGSREKFVVNERNDWIALISEARQRSQSLPSNLATESDAHG